MIRLRETPLPLLAGAVLALIAGGDPFPLLAGIARSVVAFALVAFGELAGVRVYRRGAR